MIEKPNWMSEAAWRATRTAVQVFLGIFGAALVAALIAYAELRTFDFAALYYDGVILGIAGVLAWRMNRD